MNKTIEINPALFKLSSKSKTQKNRDKQPKPLINPSVLKNKFLKRIKQHKSNELINDKTIKNDIGNTTDNNNLYTDEFNQSIEYLQKLSQERKKNIINQGKKDNLERKTIKHYNSIYASTPSINQTNINVDLPDELKMSENNLLQPNLLQPNLINNNNLITTINTDLQKPINTIPVSYKNNVNNVNNSNVVTLIKDDVPYGILKGGTKPTYRIWNKTHKNLKSNYLINNDAIVNNNNNKLTIREEKLKNLKDRFREKSSVINNMPSVVVAPTNATIIDNNINLLKPNNITIEDNVNRNTLVPNTDSTKKHKKTIKKNYY